MPLRATGFDICMEPRDVSATVRPEPFSPGPFLLAREGRIQAVLDCQRLLSIGEGPKTRRIAVEPVRVAALRVLVIVLPESVKRPAVGQGADGAGIAGDPQRAAVGEAVGVAGALGPPVGGGVDDGPAGGEPLVGGDEIFDPVDHG